MRPTLLVSPDFAGGGLGCTYGVSLRGVLFTFLGQNIQIVYSYGQIHIVFTILRYNGWIKCSLYSENEVGGLIPGVLALL